MDKVEKFKSIFNGLDRAYGQYKSEGPKANGKIGGKAFILKEPVTDKLWADHLEGKDPSLGIIPIRDDSTCSWGCIDVDTYQDQKSLHSILSSTHSYLQHNHKVLILYHAYFFSIKFHLSYHQY